MMKISRSLFLVTVLSALTFSACAQNSPYRTNYQSCTYTQSGDCANHAVQHHAPGQPGEYYLSFIEFDDQGQLWDRKQLHNMLDTYRPIAGVDDVLLVTFIHGWHHNASPEDGNIQDFRHLLADLSQAETDNDTKRKVLGVYIGWRGESLTVPVMKHITFWDRKNTAHKVGQQGVTEVLLRLEEIVNAKAGMDAAKPQPLKSRFVTIGHSFGGAILYTALQQILEDRFIDSRTHKTSTGNANGLGDLVVLMNPAFEALRYATLYDISQDYCRGYFRTQLPKLAILTSETDRATGWAFPAGRLFSTFFETHTTIHRHTCEKVGKDIPMDIAEGQADRHTVGHFSPYLTHRLIPLTASTKRSKDFNYRSLQTLWAEQQASGSFLFENTELIHLGKTVPNNPYLNIQVDTHLIAGHNDIWHDHIVSFVRDLIMISTTPLEQSVE
ncbi:MAG: hypothetical protein OEY86_01675 [Nitrospira sp.]|nr:hypothetical protein [Nitrospira sp.]